MEKPKISKEWLGEITQAFKERCDALGIKEHTKKFYNEQVIFFTGVLVTFEKLGYEIPTGVPLIIQTNRSMFEHYLKTDNNAKNTN